MCGRYAITLPPEAVRAFFRYVEQPNFPPRFNIAPTQPVPIVNLQREASGELRRRFRLVRWGFLPSFVKEPKTFPLLINARAEGLAGKASFRAAFRRRRCLFIADSFYEWRREAPRGPGRPFLIRRRDGRPMGLAGLHETWAGAEGSEVDTACIITTMANGTLAAIHERMPVIVEPENFDAWLDVETFDPDRAAGLLRPAADDILDFFEIGAAINKTANDGPFVQEPVDPFRRAGQAETHGANDAEPQLDFGKR